MSNHRGHSAAEPPPKFTSVKYGDSRVKCGITRHFRPESRHDFFSRLFLVFHPRYFERIRSHSRRFWLYHVSDRL